jgi:hypothetical protein
MLTRSIPPPLLEPQARQGQGLQRHRGLEYVQCPAASGVQLRWQRPATCLGIPSKMSSVPRSAKVGAGLPGHSACTSRPGAGIVVAKQNPRVVMTLASSVGVPGDPHQPRMVERSMGHRHIRIPVLAALSWAVASCSDHIAATISATPAIEWSAAEDLRIGNVTDSMSALTRVGSLTVDEGGRIYVSQPLDQAIRVFDTAGHRVGTFGRPGEGPGEFRQITRIGILADTLYVSDATAGRVTFFSLDGSLLGTLPLIPRELGKDWVPLAPRWLADDGTALALPGFLPALADPNEPYRWLLVRIDRSGEIVDTAALVVRASEGSIHLRGPFGPLIINQPFASPALPVVSADGSRVAIEGGGRPSGDEGGIFELAVLHSTRDTIWSHSFSYEPVPVSPSAVDGTVAAAMERLSREALPDRADAARQIRQGMSVPDHFSPFSGGVFADDGDLWVRREDVGGEEQGWMVLDSAGLPIARVTLPAGLEVEVVRSDTLWGIENDALGVPYVVRYVITR